MAYDLSCYRYTNKWFGQELIRQKYPYLCSQEALISAIRISGVTNNAQRNPRGFTPEEMALSIIGHQDQIMIFGKEWVNGAEQPFGPMISRPADKITVPLAFKSALNAGYRWDQPEFWAHPDTHVIVYINPYDEFNFEPTIPYTDVYDRIGYPGDTEGRVILLPSKTYENNTAEFKTKPFLSWDYGISAISYEGAYVANSEYTDFTYNTMAIELDLDGFNRIAGITSPLNGQDSDNAAEFWENPIGYPFPPEGYIGRYANGYLYIYDFNEYQPTFAPYGASFNLNEPYPINSFEDSNRWYDRRAAKFEFYQPVPGLGEPWDVQAVARLDGNGNPVIGGWGYDSSQDYQEISWEVNVIDPSIFRSPRLLFRTDIDQAGYSGNKARVDTNADEFEWYSGSSHVYSEAVGYAIHGSGGKGFAWTPSISTSESSVWQRRWPVDPRIKNARIVVERPVLQSTTRSLKTNVVGTNAHRITIEFEYPPLSREEAEPLLKAFDKYKGASQSIALWIPVEVTPSLQSQFKDYTIDQVAKTLRVKGTKGSSQIIISGLEPDSTLRINNGSYIGFNQYGKMYRIIEGSNPDHYGRAAYRIEPELIENVDTTITGSGGPGFEADHLPVQAYLMDDTLDYTIDAAGYYILRFKFREALV